LRRPGRLELHLHVPAPDEAGRADVMRVHLRHVPTASRGDALQALLARLAAATAGWSGAELANVCREAGMHALRRHVAGTRGIAGRAAALPATSSAGAGAGGGCDDDGVTALCVEDDDFAAAVAALQRRRGL